MPRKPRTSEEVREVKQKILDAALELISEYGYDNFSMRRLAAKLNVTATTIYQYYSNKDELYLSVLTKGFEELYSRLNKEYQIGSTPMEKLRGVVCEYIRFGTTEAKFYYIMMVSNVPKFYDYVGTLSELTALNELNIALQVWELIKRVFDESGVVSEKEMQMKEMVAFQFACMIHGYVSFCNSRIVDYLLEPQYTIDDKEIKQFVDIAVHSIENMVIK